MKGLLESILREEQAMYLEQHPTKANGYSTRDLLTLVGPLEDLYVPACGKGISIPRSSPYRRRTSLELSEAVLALYACGVSTRAISRFLEGIYGAFSSPQSISRLTQVEEVRAWQERPLDEEYYRGVPGRDLPLHPPRENRQGASVHSFEDQTRGPPGDPGAFGGLGQKGRASGTGRKCSRIFGGEA